MTGKVTIQRLLAISCLFLVHFAAASTYSPYKFEVFERREIDLLTEQSKMTQDSQGFLWFSGLNGLTRYDGSEFRFYQNNDKPNSLCDNYINDLLVDSRGTLWIASSTGLNRYNPSADNFECTKHDPKNPDSLIGYGATALMEDNDRQIWIGSYTNGITIYDPIKNTFQYLSPKSKEKPITGTNPRVIFQDHHGYIWIGYAAFCLERYHPKTGESHNFCDPELKHDIPSQRINAIIQSRDKTIWVATHGGLLKIDATSLSVDTYRYDPSDLSSLSNDAVNDILQDSRGNIWAATDFGGLNLFQPTKNNFLRFYAGKQAPHTLANNKIRDIFEDSQGNLWLTHFPVGVTKLNRYAEAFTIFQHDIMDPNSLSDNIVLSVDEDQNGNLWVGTENGLNRIDTKSNKIQTFMPDPEDEKSLSGRAALSTVVDANNDIWVGVYNAGLNKLNKDTNTFTHYRQGNEGRDSLPAMDLWRLYKDRSGNLWGGASKDLIHYDATKDSFITHPRLSKLNPNHWSHFISDIFQSADGRFWVAANNVVGLYDPNEQTYEEFDGEHFGFQNGFSIKAVFEDSEQNVWLGGWTKGLYLWDRKTNSLQNFTTLDGLAHDAISSIAEDKNKNIWISTGNGISKYNRKEKYFTNYDMRHGIAGNVHNRIAAKITQEGKIAIGSTNGLTIIDIDRLFKNSTPPPIVFTGLKIFNKPAALDSPNSPLQKVLDKTEKLVLNYKQTTFSISFSALNFHLPEMNQYAYKLEGFDNAWVYSKHRSEAIYTNIPAGDYTFKVKAANNEGLWNETSRNISITILPPWYKTWWAYTLFALAIILQIAKVIYTQIQKRQQAERISQELEAKVKERTKQLQAKTNDINNMLQNLHQGIFTITEEYKVHPEYSQYLEDILETQDLADAEVTAMLFNNSSLSNERISQIKAIIHSSIDYPIMAWQFNQHSLVREYELCFENDRIKKLEIEWNPICDEDDTVKKVLVTVRDVTQVRELQAKAEARKQELDIIGQITSISPKKFSAFISKTLSAAEENRTLIQAHQKRDEDVLAQIFRNMHTLKGNALTCGLNYLVETVHEAEQYYSDLRNNSETEWDTAVLLETQQSVDEKINQHIKIFEDNLAPYMKHKQEEDEAAKSFIKKITDFIVNDNLDDAKELITKSQGQAFTECLSDLSKDLTQIADSLGKSRPKLDIDTHGLSIKKAFTPILQDVFTHIFRNAMDHGIESDEERIASGKNKHGEIRIALIKKAPTAIIAISDDGRGLAIDALRSKNPNLENKQDIANSIFKSGVSTAKKLSEISGRGVGMDAVKSFLIENGCDIEILLKGEERAGYQPFELQIKLPKDQYFILQ